MMSGSVPVFAMLVALVVVLLLAGGVAVWAWVGRRVGDHPVCRGCGFDLTGRPETSKRCAECGADLADAGAIRVGHRRRRMGWLVGALGVLVIAMGTMGVGGFFVAREIDLSPYKPTSWLSGDLASGNSRTRAVALRELYRRMDAGKTLDAGMLAAIDRVLKAQADGSATWYPEMGDVVEHAQATGLLDGRRAGAYAARAVTLVVTSRSEIRRGDEFVFRVRPVGRVGSAGRMWVTYQRELWVGGKLANPEYGNGSNGSSVSNGGSGWSEGAMYCPKAVREGLAEGTTDVELRVRYKVFASSQSESQGEPALFAGEAVSEHRVLILPRDAVDVTAVRTPGLEGRVKACVEAITFTRGIGYLNANVRFAATPEDLAYKMVLSYGGKRVEMGTMTVAKGGATTYGIGCRMPEDLPGKVDVVLVPWAEAARNTVYLKSYADVEVTFPDIDTGGGAASRPSTRK